MAHSNNYEWPRLQELERYFATRGAAKRVRKSILEQAATCTWCSESSEWDDTEAEKEKARILASFGKREPLSLDEDFIARFHYYRGGGTAIRRNRKRELKRQQKVQQKRQTR